MNVKGIEEDNSLYYSMCLKLKQLCTSIMYTKGITDLVWTEIMCVH